MRVIIDVDKEADKKRLICNALHNLVLFVKILKSEKHSSRSVNFSKVACKPATKINTPPWVFFTFFKLYKWYQIAQRTTFVY